MFCFNDEVDLAGHKYRSQIFMQIEAFVDILGSTLSRYTETGF